MNRKRVTKRTMPTYTEGMLLLFTPQILPEFFKSLLEGVKKREPLAMNLASQIFGYIQKTGININQINANGAGGSLQRVNFDTIARHLAENPDRTIDLLPSP